MLKHDNPPRLVDTSHLTEADWLEIDKIQSAFAKRGPKGFDKALEALHKRNQFRWVRVVLAYYPKAVREAARDNMVASGVIAEDLEEIFGLETPPTKH